MRTRTASTATERRTSSITTSHLLRERGQIARVLTLGIAFAGGSSVNRSRTLREPSAYTDDQRLAAAELFERMEPTAGPHARHLGPSRELSGVEGASVQLSLDPAREAGHRLDPVVDAVIARFGPGAVTWAPLVHRRHSA
ncbi:hypothetical protein ACFZAU_41085 [Streptomyces sp. NPDC008238]